MVKEEQILPPAFTVFVVLLVVIMSSALVLRVRAGQEVVVVANKSVFGDTLTKKDVKNIFLRRKTKLAGVTVEIAILEDGYAHDCFVKKMLGKSSFQYTNYWKRLVLTGKSRMPRSFASEGELLSHVSRTKDTIGYVGVAAFKDSGVDDGSVKIIGVQR